MTRHTPHRFVHRGVVQAHGMLFRGAWLTEAELQGRVLAAWTPHARVARLPPQGFVLTRAGPERMDVAGAAAEALVEVDGALVAFPALAGQPAVWGAGAGSLVWAEGGAVRVVPLASLAPVDPVRWLDVELPAETPVHTLGEPAPPLAEALQPPSVTLVSGRAHPVMALRRDAVAAAVQRAQQGLPGPAVPSASEDAPGLVERVRGWWGRVRTAWSRWRSRAVGAASSPVRSSPTLPGSGHGQPDGNAPAGTARDARPWVTRWLTRMAWQSRLRRVLGDAHARYLARMVAMFERGDLEEALRHAIPLAERPNPEASSADPPLFPAGRRGDLALNLGARGVRGTLGVGEELRAMLRGLYRAAFERLDREGRVKDAAFVLADLLDVPEEAVAYLEKHGEKELAAQLAEARALRPELVVRQWMLAGDAERAVLLARRHGAFSSAVVLLEQRGHKELATRLRLLWADVLADAGDFFNAASVLQNVESARPLALKWLQAAWERGGVDGARALARLLSQAPEVAGLLVAARRLMDRTDPDAEPEQHALGMALLSQARAPVVQGVARALARRALEQAAEGRNQWQRSQVLALVAMSADRALQRDVPEVRETAERWPGSRVLHGTNAAGVHGTLPVKDVVALSGGRLALALGEAGVRVVDRHGVEVFHLSEPADRLVACDHGDRVLALATRDGMQRVARVDLHRRVAHPWLMLSLDAYANQYDGSQWFVSMNRDVLALDAASDARRVLWRVGDVGRVMSVEYGVGPRGPESLAFVAEKSDGALAWRYSLPELALRDREDVLPAASADWSLRSIHLDAHLRRVQVGVRGGADGAQLVLRQEARDHVLVDRGEPEMLMTTPAWARVMGPWVASVVLMGQGARVALWREDRDDPVARLDWEARRALHLRMQGSGQLLCWDDHGVVDGVDLHTGHRHNWRT